MRNQWILRRRDYRTSSSYRREFARLLAETLGDDASAQGLYELVFGELVTNAVRYGDEPMCAWVDVDLDEGIVRIVVENAGGCANREPRVALPSSEGGRGLHIVRALVERLDIESTPDVACRVTATMSATAAEVA